MPVTALFEWLWTVFPLIPAGLLVVAMIGIYGFGRDASPFAVRLAAGLQLTAGAILIVLGLTRPELAGSRTIPVSPWAYGIVFRYEPTKLYFLGTLLIPLAFSLFNLKDLPSPWYRLVFLFYLTGASGLVMTGDIFNFFVCYELMIMGAYVLIGARGDYGAAIKYMIVGSVSSALFLGGTVVLYTTGAYFDFTFVDHLSLYPAGNLRVAMLLFAMAFFVKAAFFPASGWVASCHTAATPLMSAFLAAFTIFSGIIGLYYFVLVPAELMQDERFFLLVRTASLLTMPAAAVFLFGEPDLKRTIAASTVFTIGIVGLLLSYRAYGVAFSYVLVHGFYKSLLFFVYGEGRHAADHHGFQRNHLAAFLLALVFTAGLFPSVTWFLKAEFLLAQNLYKGLFAVSILFLAGGFAKFRYRVVPGTQGRLYLFIGLALMAILYGLLARGALAPGSALAMPSGRDLAADLAALALGLALGRRVYVRFTGLRQLDARLFFPNLNRELLWILIMTALALVFVFGA